MKTKVLSVAALIIAYFGVLSGCLIKSRTSGFDVTGLVYAYGEGLADVKIYANGEFVCASGADGSFSIYRHREKEKQSENVEGGGKIT